MSSELTTTIGPRVFPMPATGEAVALDGPTEDLAAHMADIRQLESELREAKALIANEVMQRMDRDALWTQRVGPWEVKGESPERVEYDPEALSKTLDDLLEMGAISLGAADAALEEVTTYKPRVRGLNALIKLGGEVKERIEACQRPVDKPRRLSVKRLGR